MANATTLELHGKPECKLPNATRPAAVDKRVEP